LETKELFISPQYLTSNQFENRRAGRSI